MPEIEISGEIGWEVDAKDVKAQFKEIGPTEPVDIFINTPGGSIFQGIAISNIIKAHKGNTTTIVQGVAASMGAFILMAGDVRKAHEDSSFMIHNALVEFIRGGDHRFLRKLANTLESLTAMVSKLFARVTGKAVTEIRDMMDETTWLFGEEIKNAGFVDEIIDKEDAENKEDAIAFQKLAFQNCLSNMRKRDDQNDQKDIENLVAYFKSNAPAKPQPKKEPMTKEEFLAYLGLNPEAKAFHDNLIAEAEAKTPPELKDYQPLDFENITLEEILNKAPAAKTEHEKVVADATAEAKTEFDSEKTSEADARFIATIIGSKDYQGNKAVVDTGIDTFAGKNDMKNFRTVVAMADQNKEMIKSLQTQNNQPPGTPGEDHDADKTAAAKTKAAAAELSNKINNSENKVE